MKIYVFGNPLVKEDSTPLKLLPSLKKMFQKIEFIIIDPNENFPPPDKKELMILDTVIGIKKPSLLNMDDFEKNKNTPVSPHDYDLLFHLLLLKKLKKIDAVRIIGIPSRYQKKDLPHLKKIISTLL